MFAQFACNALIMVSTVLASGPITAPALDGRQLGDSDCLVSLEDSLLSIPDPTNTAFIDYLIAEGEPTPTNFFSCEVTIPASLSDDYLELYESMVSVFGNLESAAADVTEDCGVATDRSITLQYTPPCTESSITVQFEGEDSETVSGTVLETLYVPTEVLLVEAGRGEGEGGDDGGDGGEDSGDGGEEDSAREKKAMMGLAVTLATCLGVVLCL